MRYIKTFLLLILFLNTTSKGFCQVVQMNGSIYAEMAAVIAAMPGDSGNHYVDPTAAQLSTWHLSLNNLLLGNYSTASSFASTLNYQLIELTDTFLAPNRTYYILKNIGTNFWGTYVYYPNYKRPLVIQSPHAKKDANTGHQGAYVFRQTESMFYMVTGTHRCNSASYSPCSGTTTGCSGTSQPYPISDMSHTVSSIFQKTTEILFNSYGNTHFIQLHGFTKQSTDPYVILSNGTQTTPSPDYMSAFAANLYNEDNVLTFKIAHIDLSWTRLRGFWNTQSRMVNGSTNACTSNATTSQGRFFHIEQERNRLRQTVSGWAKVSNALINTFPVAPLPVTLQNFNATWFGPNAQLFWTTSSEVNADKFTIERSTNGMNFKSIGEVKANGTTHLNNVYEFMDRDAYRFITDNIYYRLRQFDFNDESHLSKTVELKKVNNNIEYSIHPNPTSANVQFNTLKNIKNIIVYNNVGQIVKYIDHKQFTRPSIDLSSEANGIYNIVIMDLSNYRHWFKLSLLK